MNVDEIIKLMQAVSDNGLTSLELKEGELKLSLKREKEMPDCNGKRSVPRRAVHADGSYAERPGSSIHDVPGHDASGCDDASGSPGHGWPR